MGSPFEMNKAAMRSLAEQDKWQKRQERTARLPLVQGVQILLKALNEEWLGRTGMIEIEPREADDDPPVIRLGWESIGKKRFSRKMEEGIGKPEMPCYLRVGIESDVGGDLTYRLSANYSGEEGGEKVIDHVGPGLSKLKEALRVEQMNVRRSLLS